MQQMNPDCLDIRLTDLSAFYSQTWLGTSAYLGFIYLLTELV